MTRVKLNREEKAFGLSSTVKFSSQTQGFRSDSDSFNPLCVRRILTPALMKPRSVQVPLHCAITTWAKDFRPILHEDSPRRLLHKMWSLPPIQVKPWHMYHTTFEPDSIFGKCFLLAALGSQMLLLLCLCAAINELDAWIASFIRSFRDLPFLV